jgi:hypothetical protein
MKYENFLEQVHLAEQLTSSDSGVSTGLINQGHTHTHIHTHTHTHTHWESSKWYFVNVERGNIGDKLQLRNI